MAKVLGLSISEHMAELFRAKLDREKAMFTRLYIEALLADECLADQVWKAWDKGDLSDLVAALAWWQVA